MGGQKTRKKEEPAPPKPEEKKQQQTRLRIYARRIRESAKKAARRSAEAAKRAAQVTKEAAKKAIKQPGKTALAIQKAETAFRLRHLLPLALISGCGGPGEPFQHEKPLPKPPFRVPREVPGKLAPIEQARYWWPALIMKNGKLIEVFLGFDEHTLIWDAKDMFDSKNSIPQSKRDEIKKNVDAMIAYSKIFFNENSLIGILEGMFFTQRPTPLGNAAGAFGGIMPIKVVDANGVEVKNCLSPASSCQVAMYIGDGGNAGKVLFHEFLHVGFDKLTSQQRELFMAQSEAFFNVYGNTPETDRIFALLRLGQKNENDPGFASALMGLLDYWAREKLQSLSLDEQQLIKFAIYEYFQIRADITGYRTHGMSVDQRAAFVRYEPFAYMGANYPILDTYAQGNTPNGTRYVPVYMEWAYRSIGLKDDVVNQLTARGQGYFITEEKFQELIPHINNFVGFMKEIWPTLGQ